MPNTVNKYLNVPNTGDLVGAWGTTAVNFNMSGLDGILGGFATISLSAATTFALSLPTGASTGLTPGAGPSQSQNALLKFTGTLTGNAVIQFTMPGFYIVNNACTVGTFVVKLSPSAGTGNSICAPPGRKCHVFFDGTDLDYVDMPEVGSALDLHQAGTSLPAWMSNCTVLPYLIKDGSTYSTVTYPALAALLGSTFGGNGASTFGVPDERNRVRIPVDTNGPGSFSNRVTAAGSSINGTTMGAAGGDQLLQQHSHTYTDPGHTHSYSNPLNGGGEAKGGSSTSIGGGSSVSTSVIGITIASSGLGSGQNMQPTIVNFLALIKT